MKRKLVGLMVAMMVAFAGVAWAVGHSPFGIGPAVVGWNDEAVEREVPAEESVLDGLAVDPLCESFDAGWSGSLDAGDDLAIDLSATSCGCLMTTSLVPDIESDASATVLLAGDGPVSQYVHINAAADVLPASYAPTRETPGADRPAESGAASGGSADDSSSGAHSLAIAPALLALLAMAGLALLIWDRLALRAR